MPKNVTSILKTQGARGLLKEEEISHLHFGNITLAVVEEWFEEKTTRGKRCKKCFRGLLH